jgi:hypothetical protein
VVSRWSPKLERFPLITTKEYILVTGFCFSFSFVFPLYEVYLLSVTLLRCYPDYTQILLGSYLWRWIQTRSAAR